MLQSQFQAQELEKARVVAEKALNTIAREKEAERLNVWIAYLNLENLFGNKESYDKVFDEAIRTNDPLKVYLEAVDMLAQSEKLAEMEEKVQKMRMKFKQEVNMWLKLAKIYYQCNRFKEARQIRESALKSTHKKERKFVKC